mgnify:CR=1 FL=1
MIPRYSRPEMASLWSPEARLRRWRDVELAPDRDYLCHVLVANGRVAFAVDGRQILDLPMPEDAGPFRVGFAAQHSGAVFTGARLAATE